MPTERAIVDAYTRRALLLLRVGRGLGQDAAAELRKLGKELRAILGGAEINALGRRELTALLREVDAAIAQRYASIAEQQAEELANLAEIEAQWAAPQHRTRIAPAIAAGLLVLGLPLARHWQRQAEGLTDRVAAAVRSAGTTGQDASALLAAIVGQGRPGRERGGLMEGARQQAATLADTSAHAAAYEARQRAWAARGVRYLKWHAILDPHTTIGCAARAGLIYTTDFQPVNHDIPLDRPPPRHFNCRSLLAPMDSRFEPPGDGQDTYSESLDDWLKRQPEMMQDELLGPTRAALWRAGKLDARGLLGRDGAVLSVAELVEKHATPETQIALWWKRPKGDFVAARVPDALRESMGAKSSEAVLTDYFRKKQLTNHPDMDAEVYTRLPSMLSDPRVAVRQGRDDVLIVENDGRPLLLVLRQNRQGQILVRSLHYIRQRELDKLRLLQPIVGARVQKK